ncbi:hypothetical protein [Methylobacterium nodulans]|uniref:Uncharacterized protein n=1 Tax=Methylobacterium nodulans (strain LMG 21967 / CNCM I-2342 / ORS 2060) TaxID=460265 RepID=B8IBS2_METNO|nr:hypothetical protein [Methylobacterium nodulans]ACL59326.1 conserved hypothetical protein [Methylobacterium nodulans ORS 2060]
MGFLLRAGLVIGLLAYASAPATTVTAGRPGPGLAEQAAAAVPATLDALPPGLRERMIREGEAAASRAIAAQLRASPGAPAAVETDREAAPPPPSREY